MTIYSLAFPSGIVHGCGLKSSKVRESRQGAGHRRDDAHISREDMDGADLLSIMSPVSKYPRPT